MKAILFVFALMLFFSCSHFLATMEPASAGNTANEELIIGGAVIRKFGPFQRIQDPRSSRSRWGHPHIGYYLQSEIESIKRIVLDVSPNRAPMFINCCHGRWLRSSLDGVEQLVNLQEVIISSSRIDDVDFSPLYNLQNLNSITLIGESLSLTAIPDFSGLASRESIQRLSIERAMSLDNLNNIKHLPNLQRIFIMSPGIGSLEGIGGLEKLESFETGNAWDSRLRIADMLPLPNLRRLILGDVRTVDITGIEQLVSLEELAFLCTFHGRLSHVKNIQYLSGLENLRSLRVAIAETDDISFFESMKGLESLHLYRGRMYVPPCEYAMAESARLSAAGSDPISRRDYCDVFLPPPLLDITAIGNLTNLTDLWITGFTVKNIAALDNIEGLCTIHLIRSVLKDDTEVSSKELAWCSGQ